MMFNDLVLDGQLWTYLADLNEQAENRLQFIIKQMQEAENVTDELSVAWAKVNQCEDRYVEGNRAAWKALEDVTDELKE